jgi:hypothetical protein
MNTMEQLIFILAVPSSLVVRFHDVVRCVACECELSEIIWGVRANEKR